MADIIDLKSYRNSKMTGINTHSMKYRLRALSEGRIRTFNCTIVAKSSKFTMMNSQISVRDVKQFLTGRVAK